MTDVAVPLEFALNHMSAPRISWRELVRLARRIGCKGVELRTDLDRPLFGSDAPETVAQIFAQHETQIHALAEVSLFNDASPGVLAETEHLAVKARRSGAPAVILIPRIGGDPVTDEALCDALEKIGSILEKQEIRGLIEPIGFADSSLKDFNQARRAIDATLGYARFGLIHDTFHHFLAGGGPVSARYVDIVHVSGVSVQKPNKDISDEDRIFVDASDRLGTVGQIAELVRDGYRGPISMEAFSPKVQTLSDPATALAASFDYIRSSLMSYAA